MLMEKKTAIRTASGRYGATLLDAYELADQIADIRADLQNLTSAVSRITKEKAVGTANRLEESIKENLLSAIAVAVALGFLFGVFTRR
jgi:ElaB/YqjD/DUF883 family membrane-anchored ribosome-binding protein